MNGSGNLRNADGSTTAREGKPFHEKAGRRQALFLGRGSPMRPTTDQREARYTFKLITSWKCVWPFLTSPTADSPCFHSHPLLRAFPLRRLLASIVYERVLPSTPR